MNRLFLLLTFCFSVSVCFSQFTFSNAYSSGNNSSERIVETSDAGYIMCGSSDGVGAGDYDNTLTKLDAFGNVEWSRAYGGVGAEIMSRVIEIDGGYMVASSTQSFGSGGSDVLVFRTNLSGDVVWSNAYGGSGDDDANGGIHLFTDSTFLVFGNTDSYGAGNSDYYLIHIDLDGNILTTITAGGADIEIARDLVVRSDDYVGFCGTSETFSTAGFEMHMVSLEPDLTMDWTNTFGQLGYDDAWSIEETTEGGYIIAGVSNSFGAGGFDLFVNKVESNGTKEWSYVYGGVGDESLRSIVQNGEGGYLICGITESFGPGTSSGYSVNIDSDGDTLWTRAYGGSGADQFIDARVTSEGGYIFSGSTSSFGTGTTSSYLVKSASDGTVGCNEYQTGTVYESLIIGSTSGAFLGSGGVAMTAPLTVTVVSPVIDSICSYCISTDVIAACDSFVWIDGLTYTASTDTPTFLISGTTGCDSIVNLDLTLNDSYDGTDFITACDSLVWVDGVTYTSSTVGPTFLLTSSGGCDSLLMLDLTVNYSDAWTDVQTGCDSFVWMDGFTYYNTTTSDLYLVNSAGCDSVITLDLTINTVDAGLTQLGTTLMADLSGAEYQWLDCGDGYAIIPGATDQYYTVTVSGTYAVEVTADGCVDTSICRSVNVVGFNEVGEDDRFFLYPVPSSDGTVNVSNPGFSDRYEIINSLGQVVQEGKLESTIDVSQLEKGAYYFSVLGESETIVVSLILN